jgi:hypothetical protein
MTFTMPAHFEDVACARFCTAILRVDVVTMKQ